MKKTSLLNQALSGAIAGMGHSDMMAVVDCGYPIPPGIPCIDLALVRGTPSFEETLSAILDELCVERVVTATELNECNPGVSLVVAGAFAADVTERIPHEAFKRRALDAKAFVRTGENTAYANILLISGVAF